MTKINSNTGTLEVDWQPVNRHYFKRMFGNINFWCIWVSMAVAIFFLYALPFYNNYWLDLSNQVCVWINVFASAINVIAFAINYLFDTRGYEYQ